MKQEWFNPENGRRYLVNVYQDLLGATSSKSLYNLLSSIYLLQ